MSRRDHVVVVFVVAVLDVPDDDLGQVCEGVPHRVLPLPPVPRPLRLVLRPGREPRRGGGEVEGPPGVLHSLLGRRRPAAADALEQRTARHPVVMLLGLVQKINFTPTAKLLFFMKFPGLVEE